MSGFHALVDATGPGDLSKLIALRALVDRVNGDGTVERAIWITGLREEYQRWYARHQDSGHPENFPAADTVHYLDEHIVRTLQHDGVLEPVAPLEEEGEPHASGEVPWAAVRLSGWAAADVETRRGEVLELLDGRIRAILEHTGGDTDLVPAAPDLPPAPAEEPRGPGAMLVPGGATLSARGLVKVYRKRHVVNEVDLHVSQGEIVGLLGPNGAGKTTCFYMMVGLIRPNKGKVFIGERNLTGVPMYRRARAGIGYLAQEPSIFRKLSVEENVMAILQMMKIPRSERKKRLETLLDELSIKHLRKTRAYALSGGERRRLEITRALVGNPKFMLLDEPFAGVDPIAVHDIQQIVSGLRRRGIGVLISDHNVEQTLDIVDRAYIMYDGRVRVSGTVAELVWNEEVAEIYLGPTLTARMRERYPRPPDLPRPDGAVPPDDGGGWNAPPMIGAVPPDDAAGFDEVAVDDGTIRDMAPPQDGDGTGREVVPPDDGGGGAWGVGEADFGEFGGAERGTAWAGDGLAADGDVRDGAGEQPGSPRDETQDPREDEAA
jgi:lipopolysaccharide export system ATP-binding protein